VKLPLVRCLSDLFYSYCFYSGIGLPLRSSLLAAMTSSSKGTLHYILFLSETRIGSLFAEITLVRENAMKGKACDYL